MYVNYAFSVTIVVALRIAVSDSPTTWNFGCT